MLTGSGEVKLGDLGQAKRIGAGADVTKVGEVMGTPHYMAPEQSMNIRDVDHRADIYLLGITLFHIVTGKRPFTGSLRFPSRWPTCRMMCHPHHSLA